MNLRASEPTVKPIVGLCPDAAALQLCHDSGSERWDTELGAKIAAVVSKRAEPKRLTWRARIGDGSFLRMKSSLA